MMKNQLLYQPSDFGQYTDPSTNRIWTVTDTALLKQLYPLGVPSTDAATQITWENRMGHANMSALISNSSYPDIPSQSKFIEKSFTSVAILTVPGWLALCTFIYFIWKGNRSPKAKADVDHSTHSTAITVKDPKFAPEMYGNL